MGKGYDSCFLEWSILLMGCGGDDCHCPYIASLLALPHHVADVFGVFRHRRRAHAAGRTLMGTIRRRQIYIIKLDSPAEGFLEGCKLHK